MCIYFSVSIPVFVFVRSDNERQTDTDTQVAQQPSLLQCKQKSPTPLTLFPPSGILFPSEQFYRSRDRP